MPPPSSRYPGGQQQQHYPPQYPGGQQYNPYGNPQQPPGMPSNNNLGIGGISVPGQLVSQQRTEELSNAVKEKWGQALGGLSAFGNRTKALAESAKNTIGQTANTAQQAIAETSTGELLKFCF